MTLTLVFLALLVLSVCVPLVLASRASAPVVTLTVPKDALYHRALVLTAAADQRHSPDHGEAKRHQVYSQLQKEFPAARKRAIGRAIEAVLVVEAS